MENLQLILSLIEGTNDLIHSIEPDHSFEFVNRSWLETLGYDDSDVSSLHLKDIIFPGDVKKHSDLISTILSGEYKTDVKTIFLTKDGDMIHVEGNLFPRREGSEIIAATGFFRNVTEREETNKQLRESRVRAEFLVDLMVHDLTNINQEILSTFEVLLYNPSFPPQLESFVQEGLEEVERASRLIMNVKKIIRLDAVSHEQVLWDIAEVIKEVAKTVEDRFSDKKLILETNAETGKYHIVADEFLSDVFYSLIHNSMKFDTLQEVEVEIEIEPVKHTPFLRIQVKDHGPGIPDEEKELIFSKLSHRRESILGFGLGLTLVKKLLENYGGYINVQDRIEGDHTKGANFVVLLRYRSREDMDEEEKK